ncbi:MAG: hypothetical protein CM1200mP3_17570 [Chloroflexota bacterium]|nr:MAG: hypothetical protein CM1200mP3_17570 [Chloroflexota bacterium]
MCFPGRFQYWVHGRSKNNSASELDWDTEHLSLVAGVRVVDSIEDAITHIENHGTGHSEAIVTMIIFPANRFVDSVDASAVMVNASTRFNDGGEFGLGAEVAIRLIRCMHEDRWA